MNKTIYKIKDEDYKNCSLIEFYDNIANNYVKAVLGSNQKYDCRNIEVAKNIQDAWFEYYSELGCESCEVAMLLLMSGPKVNEELQDNEIEVFEDFIIIAED